MLSSKNLDNPFDSRQQKNLQSELAQFENATKDLRKINSDHLGPPFPKNRGPAPVGRGLKLSIEVIYSRY